MRKIKKGASRMLALLLSLMLLAGMLLFFFGGVAFGNRSLSEHYASRPGLYHLHINPYYQQIAFWD